MMDEEFEEWVSHLESIKEPDGSIDLSKHLDFILLSLGMPRKKIDIDNLTDCYGHAVNYEIPDKLVE